MLSDENTINDVNPYVVGGEMSLPGTVRQIGHFADFTKEVRPGGYGVPEQERSLMCDVATTAGHRTVELCRPRKPNCALKRPLHPKRNFDLGYTSGRARMSPSPRKKIMTEIVKNNPMKVSWLLILTLVILLSLFA